MDYYLVAVKTKGTHNSSLKVFFCKESNLVRFVHCTENNNQIKLRLFSTELQLNKRK